MYSDDSMIEGIQDDMLYKHLKSRYDEFEDGTDNDEEEGEE